MYGSLRYGGGSYGGSGNGVGGDIEPPIPPIPPIDVVPAGVHEADHRQIEGTLEAWNMLAKMGMDDAMVAAADSIQGVLLIARTKINHSEYQRLLLRTNLMFNQAARMGILTDADIVDATTVQQIRDLLTAKFGFHDGDMYGAFYQGT